MLPTLFLELSRIAADLIGSDDVRKSWERPSALDGYTVAGLAGHLARAVLTVERYLLAPPPRPGTRLTDAVGYFVAVLADHDPRGSEFHAEVRARGLETARVGPQELSDRVRGAAEAIVSGLAGAALERPVEVLHGVALSVKEYLGTRLVELVVHVDDLAVSAGRSAGELPEAAYRLVAGLLAGLRAYAWAGSRPCAASHGVSDIPTRFALFDASPGSGQPRASARHPLAYEPVGSGQGSHGAA